MNEFTIDQMLRLREMERAAVRAGRPGFREPFQTLLDRLAAEQGEGHYALDSVCTMIEGSTTDLFLTQSKVLWDLGWGRELGFKILDQYRQSLEREGLVVKPERPQGVPDHLNRCILWDRRPFLQKEDGEERVSLVKAGRLFSVRFTGGDALVQHEATPDITVPVRWIWCQDGRMNRNRSPRDCRGSFQAPEVGLEALGGLFLYAQDHTVVSGKGDDWYGMDLPGSVHRGFREYCACLGFFGGGPELFWNWDGCAKPEDGSASRWK